MDESCVFSSETGPEKKDDEMKQKVFIAYGSGIYMKSLRRIGKEAKMLGFFSKVILYTEKDLPPFIQASPLKAYGRGDGYWVWKPFIIWKTMQEYPDSIVVYADCGCTLQQNYEEWNKWFGLLEVYDTLVFQYKMDRVYPWQINIPSMTNNEQWTKISLIRYFDSMIGDRDWVQTAQVWGGLVMACRKSHLIKMWMDIVLMRPDLIIDCFGNEIVEQVDCFKEHRHDQSLLSALCAYWQDKGTTVKILPETAESEMDAAVLATRLHEVPKEPVKTKMIREMKKTFGEAFYRKLHFWN